MSTRTTSPPPSASTPSASPTSVASPDGAGTAVAQAHVAPLPSVGAPVVQRVPRREKKKGRRRARRPREGFVAAASGACTEVSSASELYVEAFGKKVPSPAVLVKTLRLASGWSIEGERARLWVDFCDEQEEAGWKDAFEQLKALRPAFMHAIEGDAELRARFQATAALFTEPSDSARRAALTRRALEGSDPKAAEACAEKAEDRLRKARLREKRASVNAIKAKARVDRMVAAAKAKLAVDAVAKADALAGVGGSPSLPK